MKLDSFVPFGRPQSGTVIIQVMIELDVSNILIPGIAIPKRLESKAMRYFFRLKIAGHNAHILKIYITDSSLKMSCVGIFVKHTISSLY